jgi:hypothetical protein
MSRPRIRQQPYRIGLAWRVALPSSASVAKRGTVDHGLELSIKNLFEQGLIVEDAFRTGSLSWMDADPLQFHGSIRFEANLRNTETASLRLQYEMEGIQLDYSVPLVFIEPAFGGRRWYFRCPVQYIRVTKLFLPPGARRFASRKAHDLPDCPIRSKRRTIIDVPPK